MERSSIHWFDPEVKLTADQVTLLAKHSAGAWEESAQAVMAVAGVVKTAQGVAGKGAGTVKTIAPSKIHPNPLDEFVNPRIGTSNSAMSSSSLMAVGSSAASTS